MTSFNYLRSARPSLPLKIALCGAAMLVALVVLSPHVVSIRRQNQQCLQASRAATSGTDRLSRLVRQLTFTRRGPNAFLLLRKSNRKPFNVAVAGHRWKRNRLRGNSAAAKHEIRKPIGAHGHQREQHEPAATPPAAAVPHFTPSVRASVLAIVTGSRSSALLSLRGKTRIVSVGDLIDGVRVTAIGENEVTLNDHQTLTLPGTRK